MIKFRELVGLLFLVFFPVGRI